MANSERDDAPVSDQNRPITKSFRINESCSIVLIDARPKYKPEARIYIDQIRWSKEQHKDIVVSVSFTKLIDKVKIEGNHVIFPIGKGVNMIFDNDEFLDYRGFMADFEKLRNGDTILPRLRKNIQSD